MARLDQPPTSKTFDFRTFKDWLWKLYRYVTAGPFGQGGASDGYSSSVAMASALLAQEGSTQLIGPPVLMQAGNFSAQAIPTSASTTVTGWTTLVDTAFAFNASTGVYTIPAPGWYRAEANLFFNAAAWTAGCSFQSSIVVNGTEVVRAYYQQTASFSNFAPTLTCSVIFYAAAGISVLAQVEQTNGATENLLAANDLNRFSIYQIR